MPNRNERPGLKPGSMPDARTRLLETDLSPEALTEAFFNRSLGAIAADFRNPENELLIAGPIPGRYVLVTDVDEYEEVGPHYVQMVRMQKGTFWNPASTQWRTKQNLIVCEKTGERGSCLRIKEAQFYDGAKFVSTLKIGKDKFTTSEQGIANYLGMMLNEVTQLRFLNDYNCLYVVRDGEVRLIDPKAPPMVTEVVAGTMSPDEATEGLQRYIRE